MFTYFLIFVVRDYDYNYVKILLNYNVIRYIFVINDFFFYRMTRNYCNELFVYALSFASVVVLLIDFIFVIN